MLTNAEVKRLIDKGEFYDSTFDCEDSRTQDLVYGIWFHLNEAEECEFRLSPHLKDQDVLDLIAEIHHHYKNVEKLEAELEQYLEALC